MNLKLSEYRVAPGKAPKLQGRSTSAHHGLEREDAEARTAQLQEQLIALQERLYAEGKQSLLLILQARDAGGKDGTIKHVLSGVNPQGVVITSFKVPSAEAQAHDFLWRVHPHAPAAGMMAVFNRSHYEDVLVTRVHRQLGKREAKQRLEHICAFESLLEGRGTRVVKVYLHVSKDEQKQRLQARLDAPDKLWKFNPADLQERALWDEYTGAYEDAIEATSTRRAPWYVVPADHKWFRNLVISQLLVETLKDMDPQFPQTDLIPANIHIE